MKTVTFDPSAATLLTEGGEGKIYKWRQSVIKRFHPSVDLNDKKQKVAWLIAHAMDLPSNLCLPKAFVVDGNGQFIGYVMDRISGEDISKLSSKKYCKIHNITNKQLVDIMQKIANTIDILHKKSIVIGDLNDGGVLISNKDLTPIFIDVDSWSIPGCKECNVGMEAFMDPTCNGHFNRSTDNYSLGIISWKSFTRVHPFGGIVKGKEKMNIVDRMKNAISVLSVPAEDLKLPPVAKPWKWMNPLTINVYYNTFSRKKTDPLTKVLQEPVPLTQCPKCNEFYFANYQECPLCKEGAKLKQTKAKKVVTGPVRGAKMETVPLYPFGQYKYFISMDYAVDQNDNVVYLATGKSVGPLTPGTQLFMLDILGSSDKGIVAVTDSDVQYNLQKVDIGYRSPVVTSYDDLYFWHAGIRYVTLTNNGLSYGTVCTGLDTPKPMFNVITSSHYVTVNQMTKAKKIIIEAKIGTDSIRVGTSMFNFNEPVERYGLHYDLARNQWLIFLEGLTTRKIYRTKNAGCANLDIEVIDWHCVDFPDGLDPWNCCYHGGILFWPDEQKIVGLNIDSNATKEFDCDVVTSESKLHRKYGSNKFYIENLDMIYTFG